uniref:Uncharacterized protein n=1 Tax=Ornithorhynchus anatinus TaxID=9258 RepID=A0A6I8PA88_ORNAN
GEGGAAGTGGGRTEGRPDREGRGAAGSVARPGGCGPGAPCGGQLRGGAIAGEGQLRGGRAGVVRGRAGGAAGPGAAAQAAAAGLTAGLGGGGGGGGGGSGVTGGVTGGVRLPGPGPGPPGGGGRTPRAALGRAALGPAALGRAALGRAPLGRAPLGRPPRLPPRPLPPPGPAHPRPERNQRGALLRRPAAVRTGLKDIPLPGQGRPGEVRPGEQDVEGSLGRRGAVVQIVPAGRVPSGDGDLRSFPLETCLPRLPGQGTRAQKQLEESQRCRQPAAVRDGRSPRRRPFLRRSRHSRVNFLHLIADSGECPVAVAAAEDVVHVLRAGEAGRVLHWVYGQPVTCLDVSASQAAFGVKSSGWIHEGNKILLYGLQTGQCLTALGGSLGDFTCLNLRHSPPHLLVAGSKDRRVRVLDVRSRSPLSSLYAHPLGVSAVQMDDWKVVSGGEEGLVCVWDRRMGTKLWEMHARHPVRHVWFNAHSLITANVPDEKTPRGASLTDDDLTAHRRHRGIIQAYEFSAERPARESVLPICRSSYDEVTGYNYNIGLAVPYDNI